MDRLLTRPSDTLWTPHPENVPQQLAFEHPADEIFYGGAAGGGKTDLILGLAVVKHQRSLILRREFPQARSMMDRAREIIGEHGTINENSKIVRLDDGRRIEYGHCQHEKDKNAYKGRPHDLKAFDEITEFTQSQYEFIIRWNRTTIPGQRCRVVCTFNPPTTTEGQWVLDYLAPWLRENHPNPAKPGEIRWFCVIDGESVEVPSGESIEHKGESLRPRSRTFIAARVTDNPYLLHDEQYIANLQNTTGPLRNQLLYGDMKAGVKDDEWQIIPTAWVLQAQERWRGGRPTDDKGAPVPMTGLGVDVARGGEDQTVIAPLYGPWMGELESYPGILTPDGASAAARVMARHSDNAPIGVDIIGYGSSCYDEVRKYPPPEGHAKLRVYAINASEGTSARDKSRRLGFLNVRAEMYWRMREALDPAGDELLALPDDPVLKADLTAARYEITARGVKVEPKDDIKKRLGRSPDRADAAVMALWVSKRKISKAF